MWHRANDWIAKQWLGKTVRRTHDCDKPFPGDNGLSIVEDTMWDERGALHIRCINQYWTPASKLEILDEEK